MVALAVVQFKVTEGIALLAASKAWPVRTMVPPTVSVAVVGFTATRATV